MNTSSKKKDYNRPARIAKAVLACLVALAFILMWSKATTYRKVIFDYQRMTETNDYKERAALRQSIERRVGRPNTPWYDLDKAPRYLHFWDEYNLYSNAQLEAITYGLGED